MSRKRSVFFLLGFLAAAAGARKASPEELKRVKNPKALVIHPENRWASPHGLEYAFESCGLLVNTIRREDLVKEGRLYPEYAVIGLTRSDFYRFSSRDISRLKEYVRSGGAIYSSAGVHPKLEGVFQVRVKYETAKQAVMEPNSAVSAGLPGKLDYAWTHASPGHFSKTLFDPVGNAAIAARSPSGKPLVVLSEHGSGRTCAAGMAIESTGHFVNAEQAGRLLENIIQWLTRVKPVREDKSGIVEIALPTQAKVATVSVNGRKTERFRVRRIGSLKKLRLELAGIKAGQAAEVKIGYAPLEKRHNVETVAFYHILEVLWRFKKTPDQLARFTKNLGATVLVPHMHSSNDGSYVRDLPAPTIQLDIELPHGTYQGDYWKDLLAACRQRGIKVYADYYFGMRVARERYPETRVAKKDGSRDPKRVCFNNPKSLEHNLEVVNHLLDTYKDMEGIIFDDNLKIDCYCPICKQGFKDYCKRRNTEYRDPSTLNDMDEHWLNYRMECVHRLAEKLGNVFHTRGKRIGHWIGPATTNRVLPCKAGELSRSTDIVGLMVYGESPPAAARAFNSVIAQGSSACVLLWGPKRPAELIGYEIEQAVKAGAPYVGVWLTAPANKRTPMLAGAYERIRRAFTDAEKIWLKYYRDNILTGDTRYTVLSGKIRETGLALRIRRSVENVDSRGGEKVDLQLLKTLSRLDG